MCKLSAAGSFIWAKSFAGGAPCNGLSVKVDGTGNVYSTGTFSLTADFDPGTGSYPLTSNGMTDIYISKLDASGNFVWAESVGGTNYDMPVSLALDASANVIVTGVFSNAVDFNPGAGAFNLTSMGGEDAFIVKLDATGAFLWAKNFGGANDDRGTSVATDAAGNIYTAGYYWGTVDFDPGPGTFMLTPVALNDVFLIKLNTQGNFVWAGSMGGPSSDNGTAIAIDASNDIYAGFGFNSTFDFDPGPGTFTLASGSINMYVEKICQAALSGIVGNSVICQGSATTLSITPSAGATSYSWSVPSGWTGANSSTSIHVTPPASGNVSVSISYSSCAQAVEVVSVTVIPLPTVAIISGSICSGQTFTLMAFGAGSYTVQGGQFIVSPTASTTYSVVGTNGNGCISAPFTASVMVSPTPSVTVNSGSVCAGNAFTLVPAGASSYTISGGAVIVSPSLTTSYSVTGSSSVGCVSSTAAVSIITVINLPLPNIVFAASRSVSCVGESVTFSLSGASTYTWNTGETAAIVVKSPTATTSYSVTGVDANGCINTAGITQDVTACTGIQQLLQEPGIMIFPNPGNGVFTIRLSSVPENSTIEIYNLTGQLMHRTVVSDKDMSIDLSGLTNGVYQLSLVNKGMKASAKLIKN